MFTRTALALAAAALLAGPAPAADKPSGGLRTLSLWTAPKRPHCPPFVPGLQAALAITPEQAAKIEAAARETIDTPAARSKETGAGVREEFHKKLAEILTADQKALVEKLNDAYARVAAEVTETFQAEFGAAKGDAEQRAKVSKECAEAVAEAFGRNLDGLLTADQKKAVDAAAAEEKKRAAADANKPKPNK